MASRIDHGKTNRTDVEILGRPVQPAPGEYACLGEILDSLIIGWELSELTGTTAAEQWKTARIAAERHWRNHDGR